MARRSTNRRPTPDAPPHAQARDRDRGRRKRLYNVIKVRFASSFQAVECDLGNLYLESGVEVVVRTRRGPVIGATVGQRYRRLMPRGVLQRIQRAASEHDLEQRAENASVEREALGLAIALARECGLEMKFVAAEVLLDRSRVVCYFSANGRVDFRQLVRELARRLHARVEMHQIGVRDSAGVVGGLGSCGRELCCSTFLTDFEPVAIRMVKDQGLTLNPKKVSGMCGRLMCCLVYEHSAYVRGRKRRPRRGQRVRTRLGPGEVRGVDVITERLTILHEDGVEEVFPITEVILNPEDPAASAPVVYTIDGPVRGADEAPVEATSGSDSAPQGGDDDEGTKRRRRRRKSRRRGKKKSD